MHIRISRSTRCHRPDARRGSILGGITIAIVVCGLCMALVFNEYWLASAQEELRTATTAVALAAGRELATDDLLKEDVDPYAAANRLRVVAARQATKNVVAGPVLPEITVHPGRVAFDPLTGQQQTLETDYDPNAVIVIGRRDRSANNPVQMLIPGLSGNRAADVNVTVEVSVTNLIEGVRPFGAAHVPAWPIAILESSPSDTIQTWVRQIELRQGTDQYRWNEETKSVEEEPDGIPEILLQPIVSQGINNLYLVDVGNGLQDEHLVRQFKDGWSSDDLSPFGEVFSFKQGPLELDATSDFSGAPEDVLRQEIGQARIVLLYTGVTSKDGRTTVDVNRMVAARLMDIRDTKEGPQFVMQPAVVVTRTAVLDEDALYSGEPAENPYIYKIAITQ